MRFVDIPEAASFFRSLGFGPDGPLPGSRAESRFKTKRFAYQSRLAKSADVAGALTAALDEGSDIMVWATQLVFGDRSTEPSPPLHWLPYARWREAQGPSGPLDDCPGHVFAAGERVEAAFVVEQAILMGWDALIGSKTRKPVVTLSHDDIIGVHARSRPASLYLALGRLGLNELKD